MMPDGLFIQNLFGDTMDQLWFGCVVATVVLSITLHELAHGVAAMRLGDRTPELSGHMTLNPIVHMGPFSIVALLIAGLAWGAMPIDPTRMRGRYAEAIVAAAGPATNLVLGVIALTALGVWVGAAAGDEPIIGEFLFTPVPMAGEDGPFLGNLRFFLMVFGSTNLALCLFNLLPAPPLDGSHILANFHRGYARFAFDPDRQMAHLVMFMAAFMFGGSVVFYAAYAGTARYLGLIVELVG